MVQEIWKAIVGFEGLYEVSNLGQVRSCKNRQRKRIVSQRLYRTGKNCLDLAKNGKRYKKYTHQLVARAFLGEPPKGKLIIKHKNGDFLCNHADNLRYQG